jgi:type IV secretory pathway protease TraF
MLHTQPASRLTAPAAGDVMTGRSATPAAMVAAIAVIGTAVGPGAAPHFLWNASGSAPTGLYGVGCSRRPT